MKKILIAVITILFFVGNSWAGPFGTNMGDKIENYEKLVKVAPDIYMTGVPPQKHNDFFEYRLIIPEKYGLVEIIAISNPITNDEYGDKTRLLFDKILLQLRKKYGKEKNLYDFLKNGSIWKEDKYWSEAIKRKERVYSAFWKIKNNEDKISGILLNVVSFRNKNVVMLSYEYENAEKYFQEKNDIESEKL